MKRNDALKTREFYQSLGTADDCTIGRMFGIPTATVTYERRKLGIPNVRKKSVRFCASDRRREELIRKYEELGTYQKAADFFGISKQRAYQIINKGKRDEEKRD